MMTTLRKWLTMPIWIFDGIVTAIGMWLAERGSRDGDDPEDG